MHFFAMVLSLAGGRITHPQTISSKRGGLLQRLFYIKGTDRIVVISHELKKIFIKKGFPERHLKVIHNGIPHEKYEKWSENKVKEIAERWNIKSGDVVIGSVSRLKHHYQLIESLVHLNRPDIKVMLVGIRPGHFDDLVSKLNIRNPIIYTGDVDGEEVLNYYKLFDVSVLPSTTDGFGLVLLESMAMNCPVVATDFGGIRDVVKNEWNGLLFEDKKVKQLADALHRLISDQELRKKVIKNGQVTAHQTFAMENTLMSYEQFYREVYLDRMTRYKPAHEIVTVAD